MFVCNRTGEMLTRRSHVDAQYWRRHARQPVRFADSVATLADQGCALLMELGPQPILTAAAMQAWPDAAATPQTIASLRRGTDDARCATEALAAAYVTGHRLDFVGRCARPSRPVDLPTYPFQHRAYWFPAYTAPELNSRARAGTSWSGDSGSTASVFRGRRNRAGRGANHRLAPRGTARTTVDPYRRSHRGRARQRTPHVHRPDRCRC